MLSNLEVKIENVCHVPDLEFNLFSIGYYYYYYSSIKVYAV